MYQAERAISRVVSLWNASESAGVPSSRNAAHSSDSARNATSSVLAQFTPMG